MGGNAVDEGLIRILVVCPRSGVFTLPIQDGCRNAVVANISGRKGRRHSGGDYRTVPVGTPNMFSPFGDGASRRLRHRECNAILCFVLEPCSLCSPRVTP